MEFENLLEKRDWLMTQLENDHFTSLSVFWYAICNKQMRGIKKRDTVEVDVGAK